MRLKNMIAEWLYLKDCVSESIIPFDKQNSNVRDGYCRKAVVEIPNLLSGYISNRGWLGKLIRGCIRDFINAHGVELSAENYNSLAKRIISRIGAQIREEGQ